jgi:hypothetical protein
MDMRDQQEARPPSTDDDPWTTLRVTFESYMARVARDPELRRIVVSDGPSVLGWSDWRQLERQYGLGIIEAAAERAMREGAIHPAPIESLAQMLLAAINEGSLLIAESDEPDRARAEVGATLALLLEGLRTPTARNRSRRRPA